MTHDPAPIRKTMKRREVDGGVRFLTFSCMRRLPLLSDPAAADLFAERLAWARDKHTFELYAWVVMPEHVHLLIRPAPGKTAEAALRSLKVAVAMHLLAGWELHGPGTLNDGKGKPRFWQAGGGFDRNVRSLAEFCRAVRYIHRNPVKRGLVKSPELWRWSSVRWWMGHRAGEIPCDPPRGPVDWAAWKGFV